MWVVNRMYSEAVADKEEKRHQRALRIVKRLRLMDDDFMKRCLRDNPAAVACILQVIMKKPDLQVLSVVVEDTIPSLQGRGIRLDVHATDAQQREYDIEIQRSDKGAGRKRARFNSSLLDQDSLSRGEDWEKLPETYVIFITENDVLGHGLPLYHIERMVTELQEEFGDEEHIIYVNGAYEGSDEVGQLMNDFRSRDYRQMHFEALRETVQRYKENPEEVSNMCKEIEDWLKDERIEGRAEGRAEGRTEGENKTILAMLKHGMPAETIAQIVGWTNERVRELGRLNGIL